MYRPVNVVGTALCLITFLMVGCAQQEEEFDEEVAPPAEMPAPAPSDAITPDIGPAVSQLEEKNNSGITGDVTATQTASDLTVQISLSGAAEDKSYPAHIHTGSCAEGGPVAVELTPVSGGQSSSTVENSRLPTGESTFVQVHDAGGNPVACTDLQISTGTAIR